MTFDSFYDPSFHHLNSGYYWNQVINPHSDTGTLVCGSSSTLLQLISFKNNIYAWLLVLLFPSQPPHFVFVHSWYSYTNTGTTHTPASHGPHNLDHSLLLCTSIRTIITTLPFSSSSAFQARSHKILLQSRLVDKAFESVLDSYKTNLVLPTNSGIAEAYLATTTTQWT